jgi:electron transfer flavoprotein beta subunit
MNIVVCLKQILDPEIPAADFRIDSEVKRAILPKDRELVISDYDENAVEAALRIKDGTEATVTLLSLGEDSTIDALKKALAMGADEAVLLSDPSFDDSDSFAVAHALTQAIKKLGGFDLVLCGRQEGDWDAGQVGSGIAELLDIPSATCIGGIELKEGSVIAERVVPDGREFIEIPLPALLTISSEIGKPRYASLQGVMAASKKKILTWKVQDIKPAKPRNKILKLFVPVQEAEKCEFIEAETPEEAGANLALKLREAKII